LLWFIPVLRVGTVTEIRETISSVPAVILTAPEKVTTWRRIIRRFLWRFFPEFWFFLVEFFRGSRVLRGAEYSPEGSAEILPEWHL
jgi:hypothetical protein